MSTLDTRAQLHKLIEESDDSIVKAIYAMLKSYNGDSNEETDLDEYNNDIDKAIEEIKQGEFTT
ncbi:MAG TPA: hypothetical protein VLR49_10280, partial [Ferruginibacter sp.]|nr:hypothetical protein [Ferruginibacter sp.]